MYTYPRPLALLLTLQRRRFRLVFPTAGDLG